MRNGIRAGLTIALLAASLFGGAGQVVAQGLATEGVTIGQPAVLPGEFNGDLSKIPMAPTVNAPPVYRPRLPGPQPVAKTPTMPTPAAPITGPLGPMPSPIQNFAGMNFNDQCPSGSGQICGTGYPPDTNGDVGPNHIIETVNGSVAIYNKTGTLLASFTENQLWATSGINQCNGNSQGDPIALYDWIADRFIITWFAFPNSGLSPFFQCIAASKTSDPVAGGWWLYPVQMDSGSPIPSGYLNDYGKFGLWHDCLYMGANEFQGFGPYKGVSFASFNRADLYSGAPLRFSIGFLPYPTNNVFAMFPSNNLGSGANAVQPGTPNYYVMESQTAFAFEVRKFTAGANCGAGGVLSAPVNVAQSSYTFEQGAIVPQPNTATKLDMIDDRIMQKVQYRKVGAAESLWVTHPVGITGNLPQVGMQWSQINVTGGTIATTPVQQAIHAPDATLYRFMGSIAADKQGNVALGYSTSNATSPNFPSIAYAGRLAGDPLNTLAQTEVQLTAGGGSQIFNCGGAACDRWGDYSSMSVDPSDDCTFWYINQYYLNQTTGSGGNWQTRIGSFKFPSCASLPATTTTLVSSLNPSTVGASVTFTATVNGTSPTGTMGFTSDGATIAGCSAVALVGAGSSRTAPCSTSALAAGTHSIVATYSGDGGNAASSSTPLSQVVNSGGGGTPTSTTLTSSANPSTAGASVTFTASVSGSGNPTGTVGFTSDGGAIAGCTSVALNAGFGGRTAMCSTSSLAAGTHAIVANYSGDATNATSSSTPLSQVVSTAPSSTTTLSSSLNPAAAGANVTFTASVSGHSPVTGSVSFTSDGSAIAGCASVALGGFGNLAQCTTNALPGGTHSIVATYSGNGGNAPSSSAPLSQVITGGGPVATTTTVGSSANPSTVGVNVTVTATVTGASPTGTVGFTDNGAPMASCSAVALVGAGNARTAPCSTSSLTAGSHTIVATYSGDASNLTSNGNVTQVVNNSGLPPTTTTLLSSLNPSTAGVNVNFTATVSGAAPTGTAAFTSDGSSISGCAAVALTGSGNSRTAVCGTSSLPAGTHGIVATYSGDGGNAPSSSSPLSQVVNGSQIDVALAVNGGVASASSQAAGFPVSAINDGDRAGLNFGSGGVWSDNTAFFFPDWVQISFSGTKTIDHVIVYSVQDNRFNPVDPSDTLTFTRYGVTGFNVQTWNGSSWVTVGSVAGNNLVKRTVNFAATATTRIRVNINSASTGHSYLTEVEAWGN